ncbi:cdc42 effector protein 4 [Stegastes partitus]|uniref:CDC42 effector protein 4 n=1 Tax=Stegastes partitus TaxID=144197 RepID=A0A3B4ZS07_9TELE|nr:PREDICTED: cdc42 effector protein 4 [Stegastes partitus]XP_008273695.1 PREDICTED: cdc42 effector protein 4 [Stegastes partitus]XP_008273696.1 PREDICTED: cdc42 effector protein 4 [Stegastes partitus]
MPILKQLVNNSNQSKRRSRADLTAEMISAPLGDFRHTMHVGRGGDAFGDTSFLSTRSGEPPKEPETKQGSPGPKPGLLSRTFRSSKRSQSVNRGDKYDYNVVPSAGSSQFVKNAISLPYLNDESAHRGHQLPKSVSSSPMKKLTEIESKPANGAAAMATIDAEFDERNFGELTDLPPSMPKGSGLKHAESMMSFHIDLGPSMLGDILSVMEKKGWEDDDLGYEEGKGSEGHGSPSLIPHIDDDDAEERAPARPPRSMYQHKAAVDPYTPELHARNNHHNMDSCSVSSSGSVTEEKPQYHIHDGDTDSAKYSSPRGEDDRDFTFMDEDDDDEIRV